MPLAPRAVSLDLDNTLWDTPPVLVRAEAALRMWLLTHAPRIAEQFSSADLQQLRLALASAEPALSHDLSWLRTETLRRAALAAGYPASVADAAFEVFLRERNAIEPFAEVPAALARLARRVPLYAVSNGNACVYRVGIGTFFRGAVDAAAAGAAKPDGRIFARLIALAAVAPGEILHVGDDAIADVQGARAAGLQTVWMNRRGAPWPADLPRADREVGDLAALAQLIDALT
ncbi:MAG TPA: HAD-IA family hydrolase [Steroidobacteraceae bacterium]|nr:HAD-IA family hydrolase [Steroidobacteraceae bacterium]